MRGKSLVLAAVLVAVVATPSIRQPRAEGPKIAVIDVARILNESEAGKTAKKKLEARFEELRKDVDSKKEAAQKLRDEIEKMKVLLDKDKGKGKLKEKEEQFASRVAEYEKARQEAEKEMQGRQADLGREILKVIESKMNAVIAAEKIDLLLDSSGTQGNVVLHANPAYDITGRVLEMVNQDNAKGDSGGK